MIQHTLLKKLMVLIVMTTMIMPILLSSNGRQVMAGPVQETRVELTAEITPAPTEVATAEPSAQATPKSTEGPAVEEEPAEIATAELSQYTSVAPLSQIVVAGNPVTGTTNTGQTLSIIIDTPLHGQKVLVPPGELVSVAGRASIGPLGADTNILYVVDVSASMGSPLYQDCDGSGVAGDAGDDLNGDEWVGNTLDCEISGVIALNKSLFNYGVDVGLIAFGSGSAIADVDPATGQQDFTSPPNADRNTNTTPDLAEVARSLQMGEVNLFTYKSFFSGTDFNDALTSMNSAFSGQLPDEQNIAFFLSDGEAYVYTGPGSPLQQAADAGMIVNTFAIGSDLIGGCEPMESLRVIADTTGGTCTEVADPTRLSAVLEGTVPASIDRVEVQLNSGPPLSTTLDFLGNWSLVTSPLTGIQVGPNPISATVFATDATSSTTATTLTADIEVIGVNIIARDDSGTMHQDDPPITIEVLANDATSAGILTITTFTEPEHGTATLTVGDRGSAFRYAPDPGFSGDDTFTYTIFNGLSSDTAPVRITVLARPNPGPAQQRGGGTTIPEPTTITLVGLGLGGLAAYARRRRQADRE